GHHHYAVAFADVQGTQGQFQGIGAIGGAYAVRGSAIGREGLLELDNRRTQHEIPAADHFIRSVGKRGLQWGDVANERVYWNGLRLHSASGAHELDDPAGASPLPDILNEFRHSE